MFADQHGNADLVVKLGCGLKIDQVDMTGQRVVECDELQDVIGKVAQWSQWQAENKFAIASQNLANKAREALRDGGDSFRTYASLIGAELQ